MSEPEWLTAAAKESAETAQEEARAVITAALLFDPELALHVARSSESPALLATALAAEAVSLIFVVMTLTGRTESDALGIWQGICAASQVDDTDGGS